MRSAIEDDEVLEANGADPATARGAADRMLAIGAHRAVYVNLRVDAALRNHVAQLRP